MLGIFVQMRTLINGNQIAGQNYIIIVPQNISFDKQFQQH